MKIVFSIIAIEIKVAFMLSGKNGLFDLFNILSLTVLSNREHIASRMGQDIWETITRT